ncbi:hypothetical protein AKJ09_05621 [Labilithrix luteola]|uniref:YCII-related domain-containing protein n=1 Tax=Labilithrix luteola TaxID=1391654 RepID=A0A0K1PZN8_9BACT|nr:YciI family protein [Labilithrix luteola]AKU98957.1 hypothetical protein AKJ09_05621 [Labilithrix luteola]
MSKQQFFVRLVPPRPTFPMDMNDEERRLMGEHASCMKKLFDAGQVVVYGPVMAASGAFGMAVLDVANEAEARAIMEEDPTVLAKLNTYEISPMRIGAARAFAG